MTLDLNKIRARLETRRDEIRENLASLTEAHPKPVDAIEANDGAQEFEDNAVDFLEMQQEQSVQVNERALLTEIEQALERLDNGTYGKCVVCGQPIPEKRLEAIPWAARCVKDEEQLEQRNLSVTEFYDAQLD
ncbi:MAG TPA: TraR/DksA family transcriptional regulator [Ktedonobacteraceae bacterium]|nr:TraR/DksA family transcriptional regulator [Ktedonobacteraceae bacterium]